MNETFLCRRSPSCCHHSHDTKILQRSDTAVEIVPR